MKSETSNIAKLSPPRVSRVVPRERLYKRLHDIFSTSSAIWLTGPAGSGKSTLAASYLKRRRLKAVWYNFDEGDIDAATFFYYLGVAAETFVNEANDRLPHLAPEYLPRIKIFARRYFEKLFSILPSSTTLVFESCHEIPRESIIYELLAIAISVLPEKSRILFTSRNELPEQMTPLKLRRAIEVVNNQELRFDKDEALLLAKNQLAQVDNLKFDSLIEQIDGWASGLVLLIEQLKAGKSVHQLGDVLAELTDTTFSYFATEYFNNTDEITREFLLKTSALPVMTAEMAAELTGKSDAEKVLMGLVNSNFFIERQRTAIPQYKYYALFRQFLQTEAKRRLTEDDLAAVKRKAASLLLKNGQSESALELLAEVHDWSGLIRESIRLAPSLLAQGRHQTLHKWLNKVPSSFIDYSPWAAYWFAKSSIYVDYLVARASFEKSFRLFQKRQDYPGQLITWIGIIESYFYEWGNVKELDVWLDRFFEIYRPEIELNNDVVEAGIALGVFTAMFLRCPDHEQMPRWADKLMGMLNQPLPATIKLNIANMLLFHFVWYSGDRGRATLVVESLPSSLMLDSEVEPFLQTMWIAHQASYKCWFSDKREEIYQDIEKTIALANHHGVHIADSLAMIVGACTSFMDGQLERGHRFIQGARDALDSNRRVDLSLYHQYMAWEYWLDNKCSDALAHANASLEIMQQCGVPVTQIRSYLGLAQISNSLGNMADAWRFLARARHMARAMKSSNNLYLCYVIGAQFAYEKRKFQRCNVLLKRAFQLGRQQGYLNVVWVRREQFANLCVYALEKNIETDYVLRIVNSLKLKPEAIPLHLEEWPWKVRIYTLGRFEVASSHEGSPGKIQGRPMDLLRNLISLGGRNVRVDHLMENFCSEEGEKAQQLFHTNLYRMRKMLGGEETVIWESGQVSLNDKLCWLDVWAFDELTVESRGRSRDAVGMRRAWNLYKGHFFREELEDFTAIATQERLHNKYIRLCVEFGRSLEQQGLQQEAMDLYWESLKVDALAEPLYQAMIELYVQQDRMAEAASLLQRYSQLIKSEIGSEPSSKLRGLIEH